MKLETLAVQAGKDEHNASGAVMPPIYLSSTYERGNSADLVYSRLDNPNRRELEHCLAALEGGAEAVAFASGMAAVAAVFQCLKPGDHVILADDTYYGVREYLNSVMKRWGLKVSQVDMTDLESLQAAITAESRLVWTETPSNPMLKITDLAAVAEITRARGLLLGVDATWATPMLQASLQLGADFVVHSTTKYLGGHSDLTGGAVVLSEGHELSAPLRECQALGGAVPSAFDCWLLLRGIRTLAHRMRGHCENAAEVVSFLNGHKNVLQVFYPGLSTHPGHDIAARQMSDFGGMVSVRVTGGSEGAARVAASTRIFRQATSLGGVESLIEHRAPVEGPQSTTPEDLLRLSVGLEHIDDLIADLDQALEKAVEANTL